MDAATALYWLQWSMIVTAVCTFGATMVISAPYGRYTTSKGWGPLIPAKLAWFFMESPNLWVSAIVYLYHSKETCAANRHNNILMCMFVLHYLNRSVLYPLRMPRDANPMPVSVTFMAFFYCLWNGMTQSISLGMVNCEDVVSASFSETLRFYAGVIMFATGMMVNVHSDSTLINLRGKPVNGRRAAYKIPRGGMFEYVSCANYFGEIVEWGGFALASGTLAGFAFALFTFCNIGPRASKHHQWYLTKFDDYPKSRKAVIPFIW
jgi:hypothetical protein